MKKKLPLMILISVIIIAVILILIFTFFRGGTGGDRTDTSSPPGTDSSYIPDYYPPVEVRDDLPTLTVDMTSVGHPIMHGSAGFLYGISNEGVPDVNTLTPLKPKVLATKGALGTEHPYGDALDVAEEFFEAGGEQVQMYCSNYYGVFGVTANARDYGEVLRTVIAPAVSEWKNGMRQEYPDIDKRIVYIPINEGTPVNGVSDFNAAWKIYYDSIKASDPAAVIAGPNDAVYRGHDGMLGFLRYCRDNDCLPDIVTWHELQVGCLATMDDHISDYRAICRSLNIDDAQVVINEYADFSDCGVPGRLVNWIARLEDSQVYGCLPFWHQANNLNDLAANANQGNGAWWVYKWYGDMSGNTLSISSANTTAEGFYGVASADENKQSATVLCGGVDGDTVIKLSHITDGGVFRDDDRVHIAVEAAYFTGYHGVCCEPETVLEGVFPVVDGEVTITIEDTLFSTAYRVTVTRTSDAISAPAVGVYRATYEAEDATLIGDLILDSQESPVEYPKYYCSGGVRVGGIDKKDEGIEYCIHVPVDGLYRLDFLYGNGVGSARNNAAVHSPKNITQKLIIDGNESTLLLPNTLFYSMEGMKEHYVSLKAGYHKISLLYNGNAGAFHDALTVSYAGAYEQERAPFDRLYQAESADFVSHGVVSEIKTETALSGFEGNGYVTGLDGGAVRFIVDVEESGLYHLIFRYASASDGHVRVFLDNTNRTFDNIISDITVTRTDGWDETNTTIFLRQGINIIDVTSDTALDSMRVLRADDDLSQTIEAEDADGEFSTAASAASGGTVYVKEMRANDGYLEFTVTVPDDGVYKMRVFQSNNDLCGTHSYNIKIIDRYATFVINGDTDGAHRYFFPNTFSDDTFLERTIPLTLHAGKNTVRVYNDDSWHVLWGGSQSEPGTNELVNYTPNFDKFIISPASADIDPGELPCRISVCSTANGYVYCNKNTVRAGDSVTVYLVPDGKIARVTANGADITNKFTSADNDIYTAEITVTGRTEITAVFAPATSGRYTTPGSDTADTVRCNGETYRVIGDNLLPNGDFSDNSGNNMEHWYVGTNENGHPASGSYKRPYINDDGTLKNLVPLSESGLLIKDAYEPTVSGNKFYFGYDGRQPEGTQHYLVESIGEPWTNNAWNGSGSLLAFVPIKQNTNYYFSFRAYTAGGAASVRCGAINMDSFVQDTYRTTDTLNFSGSGWMACTNGDQQNVGGEWRYYSSVINSGDGDYFLFNAYWLQMASYLCMGDFKLIELDSSPLTKLIGAERLPTLTLSSKDTVTLPKTVDVIDSNSKTVSLPVKWLNDNAVDTSVPDVYSVTGYVDIPDGYGHDGVLYVTQRLIVEQ